MRSLIAIAIMLCGSATYSGTEPPQETSENEIRALLDQLVSQNPMPITAKEDPRVEPDYRLPDNYDRGKQKVVRAARVKLKQIGPVAFPYLVERWSDNRYCMTMSVGINGYCFNATVGDVCRDIVYDQLQTYGTWPRTEDDPRGKPKRPGYPSAHLATPEAAKKWLKENKGKTLYELQLMVIDWVINEETKHPNDFTDDEKTQMKKLRDELVKDGKPIARGNYSAKDIEQ